MQHLSDNIARNCILWPETVDGKHLYALVHILSSRSHDLVDGPVDHAAALSAFLHYLGT
jgi:hypothetical protein